MIDMKTIICAGPPTSGKTTVLRRITEKLVKEGLKIAYLKIDVQYAEEDEIFKREFNIPVKKVYSGELCPDHCNVMVLGDGIEWAENEKVDFLIVETAGLCFRCSPYIEGSLGMVVIEATSGMNLPRKIGPMLSLADMAVVTKIDLVSQAEREVFRARIMESAPGVTIVETNALYGIGITPIVKRIKASQDVKYPLYLRGNPPVGTCTICVGKKEIGWKQHFGVLRPLEGDIFYRGE
jgi:Ni2+-binding GTPase involved in maturation of urease and hydrogenase